MKHNWEDAGTNGPARLVEDPRRRCVNCGAEQTRQTHTRWMRVSGYQWLPLAGRCKTMEKSS